MVTDPLGEDPGWGSDRERDLVFVSYSHVDAVWVQRFQVMLAPLVRARRLRLWIDTERLQVGEVWRAELGAAIARSRVALLLVSPHFLASEFINDDPDPARPARRLRVGSLCTGYGGRDLATQAVLGGRLVFVADPDRHIRAVLAARFPRVPNLGDITRVDFTTLATHLITELGTELL